MISLLLIMIYYTYLVVTRRAMQIFACNPLDSEDDGHLYTDFNHPECRYFICRCGENDSTNPDATVGVQQSLVMPSIIAFFVVTIGYPLFLGFLIRKNWTSIKTDQLLRAYEIGDTPKTSYGNVYATRVKFHKIYYHFKPGKVYWILWIIARKAAIAIIA